MPSPANDNFANANALPGTTGHGSGTNILATAEAGEPANHGRTVWYHWTAPAGSGIEFFSTLYNAAIGELTQQLESIVQIFGGPAVNSLTEAAYYAGATTEYAGWEFGGKVALKYDNGVQSVRRSSGLAIMLLPVDCGLISGQLATVSGVGSGYDAVNVQVTVTVVSASQVQVTYANAGADGILSNPTGNVLGVYYVRVDGRGGAQGNFPLTWGVYSVFTLGSCAGCSPNVFNDELCAGPSRQVNLSAMSSIPNPGFFANSCIDFSSGLPLPSGVFRIRYCRGYFNLDVGGITVLSPNASIGVNYPGAPTNPSGGPGISDNWVQYAFGPFTKPGTYNAEQEPFFSTVPDAETANRCMSMTIQAPAGIWYVGGAQEVVNGATIGVILDAPNPAGPDYGTPVLTWYQIQPVITIIPPDTGASWIVRGSQATCQFGIQNNNDVDWNDVTASLDNAGGISGSTNVNFNLGAGASQVFSLNFNCATNNVTASLRLSSPYFPADVMLTIFLGPIITLVSHSEQRGSTSCVPQQYVCRATFENLGYWDEAAATWALATTPAVHIYSTQVGNPCPTVDSNRLSPPTGTITSATPNGSQNSGSLGPQSVRTVTVNLMPTGIAENVAINWIFQDGAAVLANVSYNIALPAS